MMEILIAAYVLFYLTWLFYIAFMGIKAHFPEIKIDSPWLYRGLVPFFILAYAMDILFDKTIGSILFVEIPKEWTFSGRILRHQKGSGWRLKRANYFCKTFLKPFDETHCDSI